MRKRCLLRPTYKLALQIPTAAVTEVTNDQASDEINEQDAGHCKDHVDDGQLQHFLEVQQMV